MNRIAFALAAVVLVIAPEARAQYGEHSVPSSREHLNLEIRVGQYRPTLGSDFNAWRQVYGTDHGPIIAGELDIIAYRIPYVGPLAVGLGFGWSRYSGHACAASTSTPGSCTPTDQKSRFDIFPLNALAVLRIDVLARQFRVPLVISPKIGIDYIRYHEAISGSTSTRGSNIGLHWAAQLALELDAFEPRAAHALDEEWGINHSYVFFEIFGTTAGRPSGDNFAWVAGLGLVF